MYSVCFSGVGVTEDDEDVLRELEALEAEQIASAIPSAPEQPLLPQV